MDAIRERIREDTKQALKAGDKLRLGTLRMVSADFTQREKDSGETLTDDDALGILRKMIKQRRDAADQFTRGGRDDLAQKELAEVAIIEPYLPQPLDPGAITSLINEAIAESGADSPRQMGQVMAVLKPKLAGRADMSLVSAQVRAALSAS